MNNSKGENCSPGWKHGCQGFITQVYSTTSHNDCVLGGMPSITWVTSWGPQNQSDHVLLLYLLCIFFKFLFNGFFLNSECIYSRPVFEGSLGIVLIKFPKTWSKSGIKWSTWAGTQLTVSRAESWADPLMFSKYQWSQPCSPSRAIQRGGGGSGKSLWGSGPRHFISFMSLGPTWVAQDSSTEVGSIQQNRVRRRRYFGCRTNRMSFAVLY